MDKSFKEIAKELSVLVSILVLAFIILDKTTNIFVPNTPKQNNNVIVKNIDLPDYTGVGGLEDFHIISIFENNNSYTPTKDVFTTNYKKESERIALIGKFSTAEFVIQGKTDNNTKNVLSVNLSNVSGIYGITRLKDREIIINDEKAIFGKDNPLDIKIDLMSQTRLSATLKEIENGITSGYKDLYLWQYIQPPPENGSILPFLFVPFDQDGKIGDTTITKLEFHYRCEEKDGCKAALCDKNELGSKCLEEKIYKGASKEYVKNFIK